MTAISVFHNKNLLQEAIAVSRTKTECIKYLQLGATGDNFKRFKEACDRFGLKPPVAKDNRRGPTELKDLLVEHSKADRGHLKRRLVKEGILVEKCNHCGLGPQWEGRPLTLQLEHINGVGDDNRIDNLCLLCPNCHSQTKTFAGRNGTFKTKYKACVDCSVPKIENSSPRCKKCSHARLAKTSKVVIQWPDPEAVATRCSEASISDVASELGVKPGTLRAFLTRNGYSARQLSQNNTRIDTKF